MKVSPEELREFVALFEKLGFDRQEYLSRNRDLATLDTPELVAHLFAHGFDERRTVKFSDIQFLERELTKLAVSAPVREAAAAALLQAARPARVDHETPLPHLAMRHQSDRWLAPADLVASETVLRRVLLVGSCTAAAFNFPSGIPSGCPVDFVLTNNLASLGEPPRALHEYDFQIVQIPVRGIIHDGLFMHLGQSDLPAYEKAFDAACDRLKMQLRAILEWNLRSAIPTFAMNFLVPQQHPGGRLMPRYNLCNPAFFIEQLNVRLEGYLQDYKNAYVLDIDKVAAAFGRMGVQDDSISHFSHGSLLGYYGPVTEGRIEPLASAAEHFKVDWAPAFPRAVWAEAVAMYRTLRQTDVVKLVVVDLDDTLWKGVSGEDRDVDPGMVEGWPLGISEALCFLKKRGTLLAIISKNCDQRIRSIWDVIFRSSIRLDDFAVIKINWQPKPENMRAILEEVNLLPQSVVVIDDNPVERAAMKFAYPDMRILGKYPYYLRRILLWSPETQVAAVSEESARRTEMVQAQVKREGERKILSREDFLASLDLRITSFEIDRTDHPKFPRAFELLNKTNQFNTTGRRWKLEECVAGFAAGMKFYVFEVEDRHVAYGLTGVLVLRDDRIEQMVMSCRVVGLEVETAVMAAVIGKMRAGGHAAIEAAYRETDANLLCRDLYRRAGFQQLADGSWRFEATADIPPIPGFIALREFDPVPA